MTTENEVVKVSDALQFYIKWHVEPHVMAKNRQLIACANISKIIGHYEVRMISPLTLEKYKATRMHDVIGATLRRELCTLKAAFNFCLKNRILKTDEIPFIQLPPHSAPRDTWLTEKESEKFIALASTFNTEKISRIYRFVVMALETASRKRAIETLKWGQIDLEGGLIHFQMDGEAHNIKRRVPVPISKRLNGVLCKCYESVKLLNPEVRKNTFFLDHSSSIYYDWNKLKPMAIEELGEKFEKVTPHTLRKTWATQAARAGVDMFSISGVMADSIVTTEKNYAFHAPEHLRHAVNFRKL